MKIFEFMNYFVDELSCKKSFKEYREMIGISCSKCKCVKHYWLKAKWQWQCSSCGFRTGLRAGTIMHKTKISFHKFYLCMALMTMTKKGISAKEMQRQLSHKRYRTVWVLMHRLREAMGQKEELINLYEKIENEEPKLIQSIIDFLISNKKYLKNKKSKVKKCNLKVNESSQQRECSNFVYTKIEVSNKAKFTNLDKEKNWITEKNGNLKNFKKSLNCNFCYKTEKIMGESTIKWKNIIITNTKRNLLGVYHYMDSNYLQAYIDEFTYKLNRRHYGENLFNALIISSINANKIKNW